MPGAEAPKSAEAGKQGSSEIDSLREQMEAMQKRLDALDK